MILVITTADDPLRSRPGNDLMTTTLRVGRAGRALLFSRRMSLGAWVSSMAALIAAVRYGRNDVDEGGGWETVKECW